MSVFSFTRFLKLKISVRKISLNCCDKQDFLHKNNTKCNTLYSSNYDEKFHKCIENGLSSDAVFKNEWIFNMDISKYYDRR